MTETTEHAPRRVKAAILRTLADAAHPRLEAPNLAHRFNMTVEDVHAIATAHGGIEQPARMLRAAEALEKGIQPVDAPDDEPTLSPRARGGVICQNGGLPTPPNIPAGSSVEHVAKIVLAEAAQSQKARTRNLAQRIRNQLADLQVLLDKERMAAAAEEKAAEEKAQARAEVERLERQLREAKAKLTGKAATTAAASDGGPTSKEIRAWARENGVHCPATGIVPTSVRDAYTAAHQGGAA